jgi:hypothetical protein
MSGPVAVAPAAKAPARKPAAAPAERATAFQTGTLRDESAAARWSFASTALLPLQAKLAMSRPGDAFEAEADRTAERVMRMPGPSPAGAPGIAPAPLSISRYPAATLRRAEAEGTNENEEAPLSFSASDLLSRKETPGAASEVSASTAAEIAGMRGGGAALPAPARDFFEPRFGYDFSRVRVHTDPRAARTTREVGARAFTVGRDIAFAPGEYRPETEAGRSLLAHELTHVVQQGEQVRAVMRACDCTKVAGGSTPTAAQSSALAPHFPNLKAGDWCVTAPADPGYNCIAWSVGDTSQWIWNDVDTFGNKNGTVEIADFDAFYAAKAGLKPVLGSAPNARVVLYATGTTPTHAARKSSAACGFAFESKLGPQFRIVHDANQLAGGPTYGDIARFYVPK